MFKTLNSECMMWCTLNNGYMVFKTVQGWSIPLLVFSVTFTILHYAVFVHNQKIKTVFTHEGPIETTETLKHNAQIEKYDAHKPIPFGHVSYVNSPEDQSLQLKARVSKVIFLTYARSGSTFLGEIINQNPSGSYVFEPLHGIYSALYAIPQGMKSMAVFNYKNSTDRWPPLFEAETIAQQMTDLLSCNLRQLPVEVLQDFLSITMKKEKSFKSYQSCLKKVSNPNAKTNFRRTSYNFTLAYVCKNRVSRQCGIFFDGARELRCFQNTFGAEYPYSQITIKDGKYRGFKSGIQLKSLLPSQNSKDIQFASHNSCLHRAKRYSDMCIDILEEECKQSNVRGAKVTRMRMENIALILEKDPDIKIIHYVRDPRGIELSRSRGMRRNKDDGMVMDATVTCRKMLQDILARQQLEKKHKNNFMVLKYEDLAIKPIETASKLYSFMQVELPLEVRQWLIRSTGGTRTRYNAMSTGSRNSTHAALRWQSAMKEETVWRISDVCKQVLQNLAYDL